MADETNNNTAKDFDRAKAFDPMEPWRGMRDAYLEVWAKTMVETVNSEAYSQATGAMLDTYLTMSAPFREVVEKTMVKTLEQLAMPTRNDVISIAERITNLEMRLDDLDAKIDTVLARVSQTAKPAASASASVRRAPQKAAKTAGRKTSRKGRK
jgi:polyhydroxyalkanoic acid synthase PhaR subunit